MADVFISYSKQAVEPTEALAGELQQRGIEVWWDNSLTSGQRFDDIIKKEIDAADVAIVVWTPASVTSQYVKMEAGIAYAWEKLVTVRSAELPIDDIPGPFRGLHTDVVTDIDRIMIALGEKGVLPRGTVKHKRMFKDEVLGALVQLEPSLAPALDAFLLKCQKAGFRVVANRSIMIKAAIPNFGEVNFGTMLPNGKLQTNYISHSSERLGEETIASDYLDNLAALMEGATVCRDGKSWTWRVVMFGELPPITRVLAHENDWIALMNDARRRFTEVANAKLLTRSA
ncbi:MAG: toll/interleukin-1 receptor domain-containing protein [Rhodomicrobium sp.]